ncbi:MAG: hypothetical protein R3C69_11175 [Geminicoccaceae bacterium]
MAISFAGSMEVWGLPVPLAIPLGLAIAALCGLLNGVMTHVMGISAFVITLATLDLQGPQYRHHRGAALLWRASRW